MRFLIVFFFVYFDCEREKKERKKSARKEKRKIILQMLNEIGGRVQNIYLFTFLILENFGLKIGLLAIQSLF